MNVSSSTPNAITKPISGEEHERQQREHGERAGEHDAGGGDDAAGHREPAQHSLARSVARGLLPHARHQEDVVVDPERHQEDEGEERE